MQAAGAGCVGCVSERRVVWLGGVDVFCQLQLLSSSTAVLLLSCQRYETFGSAGSLVQNKGRVQCSGSIQLDTNASAGNSLSHTPNAPADFPPWLPLRH